MAVGDPPVKRERSAAELLLKQFYEVKGILGFHVSGRVIDHAVVYNGNQVAAEGGIVCLEGNAHAGRLDGRPAAVVQRRIVSQE